MAAKVLEKLEQQLQCAICLDTYTQPKLLQCFHAYCRGCLVKLVVRNDEGALVIECPTCRQATPVPANGVSGLQPAFHINDLLDVMREQRKLLESNGGEPIQPTTGSFPSSPPHMMCPEHRGKELELICETCGELICSHCALREQKHHSHEYILISSCFEKYRQKIASLLEPLKSQLDTTDTALREIEASCKEVARQQASIENNINDTMAKIFKVLEARKTQLIARLHEITDKKLKSLHAHREKVEITHKQLSSCLDFLKESIKSSSPGEVLKMRGAILNQVKELTKGFQPEMLKPTIEADTIFTPSEGTLRDWENYGMVGTAKSPDPSKCHVVTMDFKTGQVGEVCAVVLKAVDFRGNPCQESLESMWRWEVTSELTGVTTSSSNVERVGQSEYLIKFQTSIKGRHLLHMILDGQHIKRCPILVSVRAPIENVSFPLRAISGLVKPWGIALSKGGSKVVVTEREQHCISILNHSGEKLQSFGKRGSGLGEFERPRGVTVDQDGNILVTDNNHRIQKFTQNGQFLAAVGKRGNGPLQFNHPQDIAFNTSNHKIYVADSNNHIQILSPNLTFASMFGSQGSGRGQFNDPRGIACDNTGNVYVADSGNHRIQVFKAKGVFLHMFGKQGQGVGELDCPIGVALDSLGNVCVSDCNTNRISVFTPEGDFRTSFGGPGGREILRVSHGLENKGLKMSQEQEGRKGSKSLESVGEEKGKGSRISGSQEEVKGLRTSSGQEEKQLKAPRGLVVNTNGLVYVCDDRNIQIF